MSAKREAKFLVRSARSLPIFGSGVVLSLLAVWSARSLTITFGKRCNVISFDAHLFNWHHCWLEVVLPCHSEPGGKIKDACCWWRVCWIGIHATWHWIAMPRIALVVLKKWSSELVWPCERDKLWCSINIHVAQHLGSRFSPFIPWGIQQLNKHSSQELHVQKADSLVIPRHCVHEPTIMC